MENEIAAHRAGTVAELSVVAGRGRHERAGDLPRPRRVDRSVCRHVARARRAARRDGEPRRHLDPARVPRRLGARRHRRLDALADEVKAPSARARGGSRTRGSSSSARRAAQPGRPASPSSRAPRSGAASSAGSSSSATTTCSSSTSRPPARRSSTRSSSSARTASTTAAAPCTAGRSTTRCASRSRTSWVWQSTHVGGDRFAGNLVACPTASTTAGSSRRRPGRWSRRRSPGGCTCRTTAAARATVPGAGGRAGGPRGDRAARRSSTCRSRRSRVTARAGGCEVEAAGRVYEVDVRREEGEPTHLTCSTTALRRPRRYVAGTLRARAS